MHARGDVAVFLDDDAIPRAGWLKAILAPYADDRVGCVGGPISLVFTAPKPLWLTSKLYPALTAYDLGASRRRLHDCRNFEYPCGANISFRISTARRLGGFSELVGPRGSVQLQHDETDLCYRLDHAGSEIHYVPGAVVDHVVLPERLSPQFFLDRHWHRGQSAAICELRNRGLRKALGSVRWYYGRNLLVAPYTLSDPVDALRLDAECLRQEALGYLVGLARGLAGWRALRRDMIVVHDGPSIARNDQSRCPSAP
jgi:GT2 family glycosyltransferase